MTGKKDVNEGNPFGLYPFFTCARIPTRSDSYSFDTEAILVAGNGDVGNTSYYKGKFEAYQRTYVLTEFRAHAPYVFLYLLANIKASLLKRKAGSTMPYVRRGDLAHFELVLPPLEEQKTIAHVLQTVHQAKDATEKIIAATRQLKQSLMKHLFTYGPVRFNQADNVELREIETGIFPANWSVSKINEMTELKYGYRTSIPRSPPKNGVEIISTAEITKNGELNITKIRTVEIPDQLVDRFTVRQDDILFNWRNSHELVGKTAIVEFTPTRPTIFASFIIRIRVGQKLHFRYLHYLLSYLRQSGFFFKQSRRAVNQANFNGNELGALQIAFPDVENQLLIVDQLRAVENKIGVEVQRRNALDTVLRTLLDNLMTGKVRVPVDAEKSISEAV